MKLFYTSIAGLFLTAFTLSGQAYLQAEEGLKVAYFAPESKMVQAFDMNLTYFYYNDGDTIYQVDPLLAGVSKKYGKPADYEVAAFPSFMSISPDGRYIWAAYSDLANEDARIYKVDVASGVWKQMAMMPSNWDLVFWKTHVLVSGLNSADFMTPSGIFLLDTTGSNSHRKIVEVGGSSAGIAVDMQDNLCFGTSSFSDPNALYRISSAELRAVIETPGAAALELAGAEKLTDLPMGLYDCEVDAGGNVLFTMNLWGGTNVLGQWNGTPGVGANYDTLAVSTEWLGMVKSRGDYSLPSIGNSIFTLGYGQAVADVHSTDYPPVVLSPLPVIAGFETEALAPIDLSQYISDLDDSEGLSYQITLSDESVADLSISSDTLFGTFRTAGQANLVIEATSNGLSVSSGNVLGAWPMMSGDYLISDFEELTLEPESYWNGSDGSGSFASGPALFHNDFNAEYFSWSGWAHSNTSDVTTPGYMNQYSAITGAGFDSGEGSNGIYGLSSKYGPVVVDYPEKAHAPEGFYVTNSSYAALSMEQGDFVAKKFGGADGSDPDYFKMMVWGYKGSASTDTIEYYLADYRFEEPEKDYIIKTWQWVDLSSLGKVDSLMFGLESSDNGDWGMNTPAYFCMDNFYINPDAAPYVAKPLPDMDMVTDGYEHVIDLSEVFSDPDDEDSLIVKTLLSGDGDCPLGVSILGDELRMHTCMLTKSSFEDYEIVVEGKLGGLSVVDTFVVHLEIISGVENVPAPVVNLYPNPSDGRFMIGSSTGEELDVSIYDITGTVIYTNRKLVPDQDVDISKHPAGAYIIRIRHSSGVISKMIQIL